MRITASALAFLAGVLWIETRPSLAELQLREAVFVLAALVCTWIAVRGHRQWLIVAAAWASFLAAGVVWTAWRAGMQLEAQRTAPERPIECEIVGRVASIPTGGSARMQFDLEPRSSTRRASQDDVPGRFRLTWYDAPTPPPRAGELWRMQVRLRRPHGFANPGGFDYEGQLFREGIAAVGYVRPSARNERISLPRWRSPVLQLRAAIVERVRAALPDSPARGVALGLAVGVTDDIPPEYWEVFRVTGITHLIAISGSHVTLIAVFAMLLVRLAWRLPWWRPRTRWCCNDAAAAVGAAAAAFYAVLAGFSVPTQRTLVMFLVALAILRLRRSQQPANVLSVALVAVLAFDPHAALAPGFWLSFLCVAAILWASAGRTPLEPDAGARWLARTRARVGAAVRDLVTVQGAVTAAVLPATLMLFGSVSVIAPMVNLLAIPFFTAVLVPSILLGVALLMTAPAAGTVVLHWACASFEAFWIFAEWAAKLPGAWLRLSQPDPLVLIALALSALLIVVPFPVCLRACGVLALVPLFFGEPRRLPEGDLQVAVLDVGQGLAVFVRTRNHTLLYDAGPSFLSGRSAGDLAVVPFLADRGVRQLDMMVISHPDADHAGGAPAVIQAISTRALRHGGALGADLYGARGIARSCIAGEKWSWDGVRFEFLHPGMHEAWSDNDGSCVLSVTGGGGRVLLTGDLQRSAEAWLIAQGLVPKADVVIMPHHGSASSSTQELIRAVRARYAIVSAGHLNRWGFPKPHVVRRWCGSGAQVIDTADWGAISVDIAAREGLRPPQAYRLQHRRYWHATTESAGHSLCPPDR